MAQGIQIDYSKISDECLDLEDCREVLEELSSIEQRSKYMATALGIIAIADRFDPVTMEIVVQTWLKQDYNTECHKLPSYRRLVEAVASRVGGSNPALAKKIAANHPAAEKKVSVQKHPMIITEDSSTPKAKRIKTEISEEEVIDITATSDEESDDTKDDDEGEQLVTIGGMEVFVPHLDSSLVKPLFKNKPVSAGRMYEFAKFKDTDNKGLLYLACNDIRKHIKKLETEKQQDQPIKKTVATDSDDEPQQRDSQTQSASKTMPSTKSRRQQALQRYRREHPDVYVTDKGKKLSCPEKRITGMIQHQVIKYGKPVGFLYIKLVRSKDFKGELPENDKVYHQVQALLYAGKSDDFKYCDYVCHGETEEKWFTQQVKLNKKWSNVVIQNALKYCKFYDEVWEMVLKQP